MTKVLEIDGLQTHFHTEAGVVRALNGVNLSVKRGETVGIVGETGSGKSVTAKSVMRLVPNPPGEIVAGEIRYEGDDILQKSGEEMRAIRGSEIAMIFQDPSTSLNPVYTVRNQMLEVITTNRDVSKTEAESISREMLADVEMPRPEGVLESYPHELSGGMKQRVMIAMELACDPDLIIADEPTTALDVTIEKKVLSIFSRLVEERDLSVLWITHDLAVVAQFCDKVGVMYAGEIVEFGTVHDIFDRPTHPYTRELLKTIPNIENPQESLGVIEGSVPDLVNPPSGCRFHPRCPDAEERCKSEVPPEVDGTDDHEAACLVHDVDDGTAPTRTGGESQ
ncbi:ABC transporter ATP-binding protein [Halorubrum halophilum]|jgi:oligopeptide/dipeptide ABC transporter ATP-binding protein|uniref:ABC transporter ATP-binding protein n=1 Tax=Halorubrum halophilum TaxID=413816 RepID=UPI00186B3D16|nr:ABC transporter ATP-binding protein [Halorubrum halophilum]